MGAAAMLTACGNSKNDENPAGNWQSASPESVTEVVEGATSAVKTLSIDFNSPVGEAPGELTFSADYDVTVPFVTDSTTNATTYKATATVKGTWVKENGEDDDYLLTFDKNTLSVNGVNAPELGPVTDEFLNSLGRFSSIEDVEVSKDGSHLTFEAGKPEVKYHFVKR